MFSAMDWIQHDLYGSLISEREEGQVEWAKSVYRDLDKYLGWYISQLQSNDYLFVVSDHGFKTYKGTLSINRLLQDK